MRFELAEDGISRGIEHEAARLGWRNLGGGGLQHGQLPLLLKKLHNVLCSRGMGDEGCQRDDQKRRQPSEPPSPDPESRIPPAAHESMERTARNASCGTSTAPTCFMRFLPSFCFSNSFRLREMSPP